MVGGLRPHPRRHYRLRPPRHIPRRQLLPFQAAADADDGQAGPLRRSRPHVVSVFVDQFAERMGVRPAPLSLPVALGGHPQGPGRHWLGQHSRGAVRDVRGAGCVLRPVPSHPAPAVDVSADSQAPSPAALPHAGISGRGQRASHRAPDRDALHVGGRPGRRPHHRGARRDHLPLLQHPRRVGHAQSQPVRCGVRRPGHPVQRGQPRDAPSQVHRELCAVLHVVRSRGPNVCRL
mmetsp:Transcript_9100/g.21378  ORF Transcript_9100/g.21378 Transcript_9100/m.21378 type:complete len:234 (+) Transcript_9100:372-1073(+)